MGYQQPPQGGDEQEISLCWPLLIIGCGILCICLLAMLAQLE